MGLRGIHPETLLFLNDSIWFPLGSDETLLAEMERNTPSLTGPMFERKERRRHPGHFESYMLMAGPQALTTKAFKGFWQKYRISSLRRRVLLRGEKGFSRALLDAGVEQTIQASRQKFCEAIGNASTSFLRQTIIYAGHDDPIAEAQLLALVADVGERANYREDVLRHITQMAAKGNIQEHFPYASMSLFNLPFLKKRQSRMSVLMRQNYLRAVADGLLPPPNPIIIGEIRTTTPAP
jgi:hypothetical protein